MHCLSAVVSSLSACWRHLLPAADSATDASQSLAPSRRSSADTGCASDHSALAEEVTASQGMLDGFEPAHHSKWMPERGRLPFRIHRQNTR